MPINPIHIPGMGMSPLRPLNPTKHPEHGAYFVDVDDTRQAFESFRESFATPSQWMYDGALVIAAGGEQTGKSALLNRCAEWLKRHLRPAHRVVVLDLTHIGVGAQISIPERMNSVSKSLIHSLWQAGVVTDASLRTLEIDPEVVFPYLPGAIERDVVVVAVMPPTEDVIGELFRYAALVPERVILLCETAYVDKLDDARDRFGSGGVTPVILRVGTLDESDGDKFYAERRARHPSDANVAEPADETLRKLIHRKAMSIGELQRLLYEVYEEVRNLQTPVSEVTYDYITDFHFQKTFGRQR